ncbi:SGNH/GDSL hydrolase family protein [Acidipila sp. EB88]|uniref:SGNH/GDSL hydrolase family protein n=1 Tax=Acidipila sp. EB88 TaxID=2305226 RepID=UPI000F5D8A70|nr:SGNH/GDSL hydrolase family protein [Acidipila sp. EB88]RRA47503.1 GDSL family lipase [Acidipila sp. EB88]
MSRLKTIAAVLFGLVVTGASAQQSPFYLHDGDRVVFYGDSITDQRVYTMIVETFAMTRYPSLNIGFVNSGWGGDRVSGGGGGPIALRLQRDVVAYKPSVVTVMLGMNDGGYKAPTEESDQAYFDGIKHIVETIRTDVPGVRITAIEPSPYDNVTRPPAFPVADNYPYNNALIGYGQWLAEYGHTAGLTLADANTEFVEMLKKANQADPDNAAKILPDHIHPSFGGHLMLAAQILKAWNARPVVAAVSLDVKGSKITVKESEHTKISALDGANGVRWTETDESLPLPFAQWETMWGGGATVPLVIHSSDITTALNQETVRVTGLKDGVYGLRIDGTKLRTFTSAELAAGVNLAPLATPMSDQAFNVYEAVVQHNDLHFDRFRHVQVALDADKLPEADQASHAMDALEAAVVKKARALAVPKPHTFELVPVQ